MTTKRVLRKPEQDLWAVSWRISTPFLTGMGLLLMLAYLKLGMAGGSPAFSATEIPWIQDQGRCERSGRIWEGNACWDATHDPNF